MSSIVSFIAHILGFLMDFFFRGLTLIGYPRLWACIVLFAAATRIFFVPQWINSCRNKVLAPVVKRELLAADQNFFEKTKDSQITLARNALRKQISKKYKIKNNSGCLTTLVQLPLLAALFYIVKHPQEFIPSLEAVSTVSSKVNTFLGISLDSIPLDKAMSAGGSILFLCVPAFVMLSNVTKMFPSLRLAKTISQKIKVYGLCVFFTLLIGWFSAKLPLAISLYWVANDVTHYVFDFFIQRSVPKSKFVVAALEEHKRIMKEQAEARNLAPEGNEPAIAVSD